MFDAVIGKPSRSAAITLFRLAFLVNWESYRLLFEEEAIRQGKSRSFINECLAYAEPLAKAGLPVIYDVSQLALELHMDEARLRKIIAAPASYYVQYAIPKRAGGCRIISESVWPLRAAQNWILRHILDKQSQHTAATAFIRGRSIRLNARPHVGQQMVLSLDVKDFFGTIQGWRVLEVFRGMGFSSEIAEALTSLTVLRGSLPQGAPTSPAVSNLMMRNVDDVLDRFARSISVGYTRYADDLTFSGVFRVKRVLDKVAAVLSEVGLELNPEKTRLMLRHQRQEVTGIVVNEHLQVPRAVRRGLRQEIHYIKTVGLEEHCSRVISLYGNRLDHLRGLAEFVLFVNPEDRDAKEAIATIGRVRFVK